MLYFSEIDCEVMESIFECFYSKIKLMIKLSSVIYLGQKYSIAQTQINFGSRINYVVL